MMAFSGTGHLVPVHCGDAILIIISHLVGVYEPAEARDVVQYILDEWEWITILDRKDIYCTILCNHQ